MSIDSFGQRRGTIGLQQGDREKVLGAHKRCRGKVARWQPYGNTRNERLAFAANLPSVEDFGD